MFSSANDSVAEIVNDAAVRMGPKSKPIPAEPGARSRPVKAAASLPVAKAQTLSRPRKGP
jgi:hypothetical protein